MPTIPNASAEQLILSIYPTGSSQNSFKAGGGKATTQTTITLSSADNNASTPIWSQCDTSLEGALTWKVLNQSSGAGVLVKSISINKDKLTIQFGDISGVDQSAYVQITAYVLFEGVTTVPSAVYATSQYGAVSSIVGHFVDYTDGDQPLPDGQQATLNTQG